MGSHWLTIVAGPVGLIATYAVGALFLKLAPGYNLVSNRTSETGNPTVQTAVIPTGFGIVAALFLLALGITGLATGHFTLFPWLGYLFGGSAVAAVGFWDDWRHARITIRLIVQTSSAVLVLLTFGAFESLDIPGLGRFELGVFGQVLTFLWVVGLINAFNFMDGIDGMAGGLSTAMGTGWYFFGQIYDSPAITVLGLAAASTAIAFLAYNRPPARMFMGDVGSTFYGFTFAVLPLAAQKSTGVEIGLAPVIALFFAWAIVWDTFSTFCHRLIRRRSVFKQHRWFLFHRLVESGLNHRSVALLYFLLTGAGCSVAIGYAFAPAWFRFSTWGCLIAGCILLYSLTSRFERKNGRKPLE